MSIYLPHMKSLATMITICILCKLQMTILDMSFHKYNCNIAHIWPTTLLLWTRYTAPITANFKKKQQTTTLNYHVIVRYAQAESMPIKCNL